VRFSQKTAIISLNSVNKLIFVTVKCDVFFAVRTELLNAVERIFGFKRQTGCTLFPSCGCPLWGHVQTAPSGSCAGTPPLRIVVSERRMSKQWRCIQEVLPETNCIGYCVSPPFVYCLSRIWMGQEDNATREKLSVSLCLIPVTNARARGTSPELWFVPLKDETR
jgi:hypothetical protein